MGGKARGAYSLQPRAHSGESMGSYCIRCLYYDRRTKSTFFFHVPVVVDSGEMKGKLSQTDRWKELRTALVQNFVLKYEINTLSHVCGWVGEG